jgi:outer membrane protein OmpA-like peptidoglycan-associated protein
MPLTMMRPPVIFLILLIPGMLSAQKVFHIGGRLGYEAARHATVQDVRSIDGDCGRFVDGKGQGISASVLGEIELFTWLRGTMRFCYAPLGGSLTAICDNGIIVPTGKDNEFVPLVREYKRDITLRYGLVELGVKLMPLELPVYLSAAISVGAPIFGAAWSQDERIVSPVGALFPDFTTRRSNGGGDYTNTQLRTALLGGIGYAIPLRTNVEFSPELLYSYPLTNVTVSDRWNISYLSAGATLTWRFELAESVPPPAPPVEPPPPPPPVPLPPVARIGAATDASIDIVQTFVTETYPLLPYVFFGQGSASLQEHYRTRSKHDTAAFSESALPRKTLDIYYHLLDIMGRRLQTNPSIQIKLVGSTDDKDTERGDTALARRRAEAVKSYFTGAWSIDPKRIAVTTARLPQFPSTLQFAEGDEENRRVEILSSSDELFRPVVHERLSEFEITPPVLEIALGAEGSSKIARWSLNIRLGAETVGAFGESGAPPSALRWRLDDAVAARAGASDALNAVLTITDEKGLTGSSTLAIPVRKKQNSYEVGRLSLIVFDFDRSDILPHNQRMIRGFVAEAIHPTSSVTITGSTDRLGEEEHNVELSSARAENVKRILLSQNPAYEKLESRGIGEAPDLFDNNLPEGRFYCRTVAVEVRTPVK